MLVKWTYRQLDLGEGSDPDEGPLLWPWNDCRSPLNHAKMRSTAKVWRSLTSIL